MSHSNLLKRRVWAEVQHRFAATHSWPDAPSMVPAHAYLAHEHRHVFHVKLAVTVTHNDREVEFLDMRSWLVQLPILKDGGKLGQMSCEMIAEQIISEARKRWDAGASSTRSFRCSVFEDGENGAVIEELA